MLKPKPCPFCGADPAVHPADPDKEGNAWATVFCGNIDCAADTSVSAYNRDPEDGDDPDAYFDAAIRRWNKRA